MPRPTVLVVDGNDARRKDLARGLAEFGYEVVSAENAANGMRFATGLSPRIIVADDTLEGFGDATVLKFVGEAEDGDGRAPFLVLMSGEDREREDLPEEVVSLNVAALTVRGILRKLRTLLVAQELGLENDARLESVIGDLYLTPIFELLPELQKVVMTGRLLFSDGELALEEGNVVAARSGQQRGRKAFCRATRTSTGTLRLLLGPTGAEREIDDDLLSLMATAMEDQHRFEEQLGRLPDWESRIRIEIGPAFFATQFTAAQQSILEAAQAGKTIRGLVEAVDLPDGIVLEELSHLVEMGFVTFDEPEIRVRVVTDSTADLAPEVARMHRVHTVPLSVIFDKEIFKDGIDLTPGGFYKMLKERDAHPRTNPPSKGEFLADYRALVEGSDIVSIHISERMSQTVVHAREAQRGGGGELSSRRDDGTHPTLEIVDSRQVSTGLGLMVMLAARMAQRGVSAAELAQRVREMVPRFHLLFVVDTLEYLARGGRIGKARALLGGLLGIKPILGLVDGEVAPVDRVRGGKAAHPKVVELFKQRVDAERPVIVGVGHAAAPVWAERLRTLLESSFTVSELMQGEIGPVVGSHTGPGCVGAVMFQPTDEEAALVAPLESEGE